MIKAGVAVPARGAGSEPILLEPYLSPRPLRILMVAARYLPLTGGIETHVHEVGSRLVSAGHAVTVLTADSTGRLATRDRSSGMDVIRVKAWPDGRDWCLAPNLHLKVAAAFGKWDVVHVQGYHTFSAPFAMLGAIRAKVPFILTFHSGGHSSPVRTAARGAQRAMLAPLARRAARLIGVSRFEADHFSRTMGIPRTRFDVVPNGAGFVSRSADPELGKSSDGPLIVSLGRLERYKGHHRAIDCFAELLTRMPNARLRILGEGPYEGHLRDMVAARGLKERVHIGGIPPADRTAMAETLTGAALVVLLSDYEAHPVAVMEALSLGRRVVTTDTSGFRELAEMGLVRAVPLDAAPASIAAVMEEEIGKGAASITVPLPNWEDCASRLTDVYRFAIAGAM